MLKNNYVELEKKRDNAINNLIKMLNQCTLKKVDNINLSNEKPYSLDTIEYEHSTKTSYYFDLPPKKNTYLIGLSEQKKVHYKIDHLFRDKTHNTGTKDKTTFASNYEIDEFCKIFKISKGQNINHLSIIAKDDYTITFIFSNFNSIFS